ncbi:MAG: tRNA (adenosine(37)-N6)-threonylcarbamoyltransferase complex transferase subunit TsaD [Gammaproteobacteria bacterium]|nr:tRNA (adenosine(37)-N6)-threonylcarbamoyltransferase complex transferase subunit TsaD [Gammaproteobacteria bacterium]
MVLGIETSCDETGVALVGRHGVVAEALYSQVAEHAAYGGVVPELAARDHVAKLLPLVKNVLADAENATGTPPNIGAIAYTAGPGLVGALLVGAGFARSLAYSWQRPAIAVHHLEAHVLAPLMADATSDSSDLGESNIEPPFLVLLVSGGHTELIEVVEFGVYRQLGATRDDAVGEAFDKTAKLLGLGYPGGPAVEQAAKTGRAGTVVLPRPMLHSGNLDFSFSGLKTAVRQHLGERGTSDLDDQARANIAYAFQQAVVDTLVSKCQRALDQTGHNLLLVVGGVAANQCLREHMTQQVGSKGVDVVFPPMRWCTDNGAMVAWAGWWRWQAQQAQSDLGFSVRARWPLSELEAMTLIQEDETRLVVA